MIQLAHTKIHVGTRTDVQVRDDPAWATVNVSNTVHLEILKDAGCCSDEEATSYAYESGQLLSFGWVDGEEALYDAIGTAAFISALDFIDRWYPSKQIMVSCFRGKSRSPTLALIYLAKRLGVIPDGSFAVAKLEFQELCPTYDPGGIADYVSDHWKEIR